MEPAAQLEPRRLTCERCNTEFACSLSGDCWCAAESFKLPIPTAAGQDCLCPDCLRRAGLKL